MIFSHVWKMCHFVATFCNFNCLGIYKSDYKVVYQITKVMARESVTLEYKKMYIFVVQHSLFEEISYGKVPLE